MAPIEAEWANCMRRQERQHGHLQPGRLGHRDQGHLDPARRLRRFGCADDSDSGRACHSCLQIPWALSATGVGFNLPGVHKLRLSGPVLAGIYLGQITNWNDSRITRFNKGVHLPNLKITPVFRSDGSGDTYAFTNYLSEVSSTWRHRVGFATTVSFPTGVGGSGNSGVTRCSSPPTARSPTSRCRT